MLIRDAEQAEMGRIGDIRVTAYRAGGHMSEDSEYEPRLRELGTDGSGDVLVAIEPENGAVVGTVMLRPWPNGGQLLTGPGEAEIRALAVLPEAQGAGLGRALLDAVVDRAVARAVGHLLLYTQPDMTAARHMYEETGFGRLPERDWKHESGFVLLAYGLRLDGRTGVAGSS